MLQKLQPGLQSVGERIGLCGLGQRVACHLLSGRLEVPSRAVRAARMRSLHRLATSRAAICAASRSAIRRKFSSSSTLRVVGRAHISARFQLTYLLVGLQIVHQQVLVECAIGVGYEGPRRTP